MRWQVMKRLSIGARASERGSAAFLARCRRADVRDRRPRRGRCTVLVPSRGSNARFVIDWSTALGERSRALARPERVTFVHEASVKHDATRAWRPTHSVALPWRSMHSVAVAMALVDTVALGRPNARCALAWRSRCAAALGEGVALGARRSRVRHADVALVARRSRRCAPPVAPTSSRAVCVAVVAWPVRAGADRHAAAGQRCPTAPSSPPNSARRALSTALCERDAPSAGAHGVNRLTSGERLHLRPNAANGR